MQEKEEEEGAVGPMRLKVFVAIFAWVLLGGLVLGALGASAYRAPMTHPESPAGREEWIPGDALGELPFLPGERQIEGACGLAVSPSSSTLYVSDYYHRAVHLFGPSGTYNGTRFLPGGDPLAEINELNSACGLAADAAGNLYANEFHQSVVRLAPSEQTIDLGQSTGVAVDEAGDVYVDDRTYVAVYDAPIEPEEAPVAKIGLGSLDEAFGVAVNASGSRVYVPDAADGTVKIFEPAVSLSTPVGAAENPPGRPSFNSLFDAAVAVDDSAGEGNGHFLVVDNLEPLHELPRAAIYEFGPQGEYLDTLQPRLLSGPGGREIKDGPIFGEPSGIAVDSKTGFLYATTGNSEESNLVAYGPYTESGPPLAAPPGGDSAGSAVSGALGAQSSVADGRSSATGSQGASASVAVRRGGVQVNFDGKLTPHALPRHGMGPVGIVVDAKIAATGGDDPPQLRRIAIAINRNGQFSSQGLPVCRLDQIQPSTTEGALAACGDSLVGEGRFSANVKLPQQSPFPSSGKVLAFNGRVNGKPAILAHIYGTQPAPTSTVLSFLLRPAHGTYGTILEASLPQATGSWGYVTGLRMSLRRRFNYRGRARSYLSAGCPAPAGFRVAAFPLAKTSFSFAGNLTLAAKLEQTCRAQG
jgi:DNA-binding beta-propeller fold protein YncE